MFKKLLSTPIQKLARRGGLGKAGRFAVFQIKMWSHCARLLKKNRANYQAAALSYYTMFGIVPLAIVILLFFQLFPAYSDTGEQVKDFLYSQMHLSEIQYQQSPELEGEVTVTAKIDNIVDNFFGELEKGRGSVTLISVIIIIWAALMLLSTIEGAFNNIWHVAKGRSFLRRIINYWALLTLAPILIAAGIYVSAHSATLSSLQKTLFSAIGPVLLNYLISVVAFFLLYFILPNTKVSTKAALWGAAAAALVWSVAKWGFGIYVTRFIPYSAIYGVLGLIPLTVFWIFVTWLIVLFGLQLAFATQYLESLDAAALENVRETDLNFIADELTVIDIMAQVAEAFEKNQAPLAEELISSKLNLPPEFADKILADLVSSRLLLKVSEPAPGYIPARDPANIKLSEIYEAVSTATFKTTNTQRGTLLEKISHSHRQNLEQYSLKQILSPAEPS